MKRFLGLLLLNLLVVSLPGQTGRDYFNYKQGYSYLYNVINPNDTNINTISLIKILQYEVVCDSVWHDGSFYYVRLIYSFYYDYGNTIEKNDYPEIITYKINNDSVIIKEKIVRKRLTAGNVKIIEMPGNDTTSEWQSVKEREMISYLNKYNASFAGELEVKGRKYKNVLVVTRKEYLYDSDSEENFPGLLNITEKCYYAPNTGLIKKEYFDAENNFIGNKSYELKEIFVD